MLRERIPEEWATARIRPRRGRACGEPECAVSPPIHWARSVVHSCGLSAVQRRRSGALRGSGHSARTRAPSRQPGSPARANAMVMLQPTWRGIPRDPGIASHGRCAQAGPRSARRRSSQRSTHRLAADGIRSARTWCSRRSHMSADGMPTGTARATPTAAKLRNRHREVKVCLPLQRRLRSSRTAQGSTGTVGEGTRREPDRWPSR